MDVREIIDKVKNAQEQGATLYLCESGDTLYEAGEAPPLRECSNDQCGHTFVSEERNCEECNRPFTRKEADHGCEDCCEPCEEVDV